MPPRIEKQKPTTTKRTTTSQSSTSSAWDMVDTIRMLLYGRSGTGKTTLWATFPGPILALVCSGGNKPGELRSIDTPEYREKITPKIINSTDDFKREMATAGDYATVVLDHISGLSDLILREILGLDELPAQKSWGLASQQQYGTLAQQCKEYLRALLNLSGNVVIIAQERTFGEESTSDLIAPTVGAALTPSVVGWLNPACDFVVRTFIKQRTEEKESTLNGKTVKMTKRTGGVDYCLLTAPSETYHTKFRIPRGSVLPEYIIDPTYDSIHNLIKGDV